MTGSVMYSIAEQDFHSSPSTHTKSQKKHPRPSRQRLVLLLVRSLRSPARLLREQAGIAVHPS